MWITYKNIEQKKDLVSKKSGKTYTGWVLNAIKQGYGDAPDEEYQKIFFDNSATTIIEHGRRRPNMSIVQYFKKGCEEGDTVVVTNKRVGNNWEIESLENITRHSSLGTANSYEPLSEEEVMAYEVIAQPTIQPTTPDQLPWAA